MTQLVGRILRLPQVTKTGREALDACYVLCFDANTAQVVRGIKKSLETEGMGDLAVSVNGAADTPPELQPITLRRRPAFAKLRLFLPKVTWAAAGEERRELVYDSDVLAAVPWPLLNPAALALDWAPNADAARGQRFDVGLELLNDAGLRSTMTGAAADAALDRTRIVRSLIDLAPNAWQVWSWVESVVQRLLATGYSERLLASSSDSLIERLRADLEQERDRLAQIEFERLVAAGCIEFCLRADATDYELPHDVTLQLAAVPVPLIRNDGQVAQKSLLEPALRTPDLNQWEAAVAVYLDEKAALRWWHRNVAKTQYSLQGWQRHKVYPDFVFAHLTESGEARMVLLETKGLHLKGPDTTYKQALMRHLSDAFRDERFASAGELVLEGGRERLVCDLVFDTAWRGSLDRRHFDSPGSAPAAAD